MSTFTVGHIDNTERRNRRLNILQWIGIARSVARQRRALRDLDRHQLQDLGISAAAAEKEANRPLWDLD